MQIVFYSLTILIVSGLLALCLNRFFKPANFIGALGAISGCIVGLISLFIVYNNPASAVLTIPWTVPYGSLSLAMDNLGILFLFLIFIVSALSALYGMESLRCYSGKKNIGSLWLFFNLLIASMVFIVLARNAILFLLAWEMMAISSFFLVVFAGEKKAVAKAGLIYLIATHIGTLFLLVMFGLLGNSSGSFDFSSWKIAPSGFMPSIIFLCALIGFGTKSGFMPMHIWLPETYPAAPNNVAAVLSGVMSKTGIYGLIRILTFLGMPCSWWGYLLIAMGIISGILGILFALAQHDLKRLLAYSSIENIGIISIGMGVGILGMSTHNPVLMVLGFSGSLLHVINHAFFKALLFLGAGAVLDKTQTMEMDVLGGLFKKMPITGISFLIGAAAICGLPPLNGFISEFLIYLAAFKGILGAGSIVFVSLGIIAALALIGAVAVACFTKVFGIIFLGQPRSVLSLEARDPGILMRISMLILAFCCFFIGLAAPFMVNGFAVIIAEVSGTQMMIEYTLAEVIQPLRYIVSGSLLLYGFILLLVFIRWLLLRGRRIESALTWDCGYAKPSPKMQYTASSFAQPIVNFFKGILRTKKHASKINEYFPDSFGFKTETADLFSEKVFNPMLKSVHDLTEKLTWVQHGQLQIYILYILFTLLALFIWKL
ncbi:MAG: hydrogenase [Candidatus Omnitrophica bacterium]|nr:hydrogenase [Candidatus Omnitrophota bacterium]